MTSHEEDAERLLRVPMLADCNALDDDPTATNGKPADLRLELCGLLSLSAPVMVQLSAQYAVTVVNQYFIGHQGAGPLAAAAIGNTWFNVCWYFLMGVSTALDTLGSQAHGEGNPNAVISCCVSAISVLSLLCVPVAVAMLTADSVSQAIFQQSPQSGQLVGVFCKGLLPGLLPLVWSIAILKAMQVQNMVWAPAVITVLTALANVPINMVLIAWYGFWGAALATSVARILQLALLGVSPHVLSNFLVLGLPGGVMMAADACSFDVTTVMASILGQAQVDAHSILLTFCAFIYVSFPFGVSTAATIRVGNLVGANRPSEARLAGFLSVALGAIFMAGSGLFISLFRQRIGPLFVDDLDVTREVAKVAPICAGYQIFDGIAGTSSGVLRGLGRQASLMWFNVLGFWMVGFTMGWALTFKAGLGLSGIWLGILGGVTTTAVLCFGSMLQVDWQEEARKARRRWLDAHKEVAAVGLLQPAVSGTDLEQPLSSALDTLPEQSGPIPQAVSSASTAISMAVMPQMGTDPRISIQPFGTPGQRNFVGSYGSQHFANPSNRAWSPP
ncbi:MAG: hypothetical protein FRX49_00568 [Trebouxia sp. A1-2]|nr:MAG: hypothetical protein FRX49_00568 [Trebouxia sp. A1-2]